MSRRPTGESGGASSPGSQPVSRTVHLQLGVLFGLLWLLSSLHLLVFLRREVWPHGWPTIVMCAVQPAVPLIQLAWGNVGAAILFALPAVFVGVTWRAAARRPDSRGGLVLARCAIVVYWFFYDFVLGVGA